VVLAAVLALALMTAGCGGRGDAAAPNTTAGDIAAAAREGSITTEAEAAATAPRVTGDAVHYSTLEVGQCFVSMTTAVKGASSRVYERVPCDGPHDGEVYDRTSYPAVKDQPYPGDSAMHKWAVSYCYNQFASFVGVPYERSAYGIDVLTPTEENFTNPVARYRGVTCFVASGGASAGQLVGSAKNTRM
jgi:hypothetical protein